MTVDPAMIVIGGGLSAAHEQLLDPLRAALPATSACRSRCRSPKRDWAPRPPRTERSCNAFQRHAAEIYGIEDMPAPPITPLPIEAAGTDDTTVENTEEKQ